MIENTGKGFDKGSTLITAVFGAALGAILMILLAALTVVFMPEEPCRDLATFCTGEDQEACLDVMVPRCKVLKEK